MLCLLFVEYVVDEHVIDMLLEKAGLYPATIAAYGEKARDAFRKVRVVTKRSEEPSSSGVRFGVGPRYVFVLSRIVSQR